MTLFQTDYSLNQIHRLETLHYLFTEASPTNLRAKIL